MKKICNNCSLEKDLADYYKHPKTADGRLGNCKDCSKEYAVKKREHNPAVFNERDQRRYRHNLDRLLKHRYRLLVARSTKLNAHNHSAYGKPYLTYAEFMQWYDDTAKTLKQLYDNWASNNFIRKLAPSIDRIDNNKGYIATNIQWVTLQENSRKG